MKEPCGQEYAATGQTSINIPIPDKDTVSNFFTPHGKLLGGG